MANYTVEIFTNWDVETGVKLAPVTVLQFQADGLTRRWSKIIKDICSMTGDDVFAKIKLEDVTTAYYHVISNSLYNHFLITLVDLDEETMKFTTRQYSRMSWKD